MEERADLTWRVHLARRQPERAAAAIAAVLAAGAWAYVLFGSLLPAAAAVGLLLAAVGEFLFPIVYRLTPEGAEARSLFAWRRIAWREVRQVYPGEDAIKLSPLAHGSPREAFRGVLLRCEGNRDAVLATVNAYREAEASDAPPRTADRAPCTRRSAHVAADRE